MVSVHKRKYWLSVIGLAVANTFIWTFAITHGVSSLTLENGELGVPRPQLFKLSEAPSLPAEYVGDGERQTRLLYKDFAEVHGRPYRPRSQQGPSCVGNATACAIDMLGGLATKSGIFPRPPPPASAGWLYGISREIGGLPVNSNGSHVRLCVQAAHEIGFLYEENFFMLGYDLTTKSYEREWRNGPPSDLGLLANTHIIAYFKLRNYDDVRDAIASGMPVVVGSQVGFGRTEKVIVRDDDGFLREPMFRFRGKYWFHAMCFIGVCDIGREGVLCQNSWGSGWVTGPTRFGDEPAGSFWVDKTTVNKMVRAGDCYAILGLHRR